MTVDSGSVDMPTPGTYLIDPQRSSVSYSGRHLFGLGRVQATFAVASGELRVADPPTASGVQVSVDAASFTSDNARRDKDVRSARFLDVAAYPDITFVMDGVRESGSQWAGSGSVTAHGSTVPVDVTIDRVAMEGGVLRAHAKAERLDRYAFGVTKAKGMVGRYLDLDLDVTAVPA